MTAFDHLNDTQFRPIEEIGALESQYPPMSVEEAYQAGEHLYDVANPASGHEMTNEAYMQGLREHMSAHGSPPVSYRAGALIDGHHHYAAARDLGWKTIPAKPWRDKTQKRKV